MVASMNAPAPVRTKVATRLEPENAATLAHINLLQGIITRLAGNSAACKTWCLTLVTAILSLAGTMKNPALVEVALVPVIVFGFIDTMYLAQERAYRDLYSRIVEKINTGNYTVGDVFDARPSVGFFCLCWLAIRSFFSWAIWPVYLGVIALYVFAAWIGALEWLTKG
jgi:hypothetical protein